MKLHKDLRVAPAPDPWLRVAALDVSTALSLKGDLKQDDGVLDVEIKEEWTGWILYATFRSRADWERVRQHIHKTVREARG